MIKFEQKDKKSLFFIYFDFYLWRTPSTGALLWGALIDSIDHREEFEIKLVSKNDISILKSYALGNSTSFQAFFKRPD